MWSEYVLMDVGSDVADGAGGGEVVILINWSLYLYSSFIAIFP